MDDIRIELVISGIPGYFKLRSQHDDLFRLTALSLKSSIEYLESKLPGNVDILGLFNAYTEETMARRASGENINVPFREIFPKGIHADSGGLQMITLGKGSIEKEDRLKIYKTQLKYADSAMSFDEIPAVFIDDVRYYLPKTVKEKGIKAGEYLREQYDFFNENKDEAGHDCEIIPILQGWGKEDTELYAEGLFSQFSKEELDSMKIVATGFPTGSPYATAMRIFDIFEAENLPKNIRQHLHLLGVTGFKRVIPALILIKNGFTPELKTLSFDSVTLAMSYVMGGMTPSIEDFKNNIPKPRLGKKRNKAVEEYWQKIYDFWKDDPNFPFDDLDDMLEHSYYNSQGLNSGFQQYEYYLKKDEEGNFTEENKKLADYHFMKVLKQEQYYILYQVHNYIQILEEFLLGNIKLEHIFKGKDLTIFQGLEKVKTKEDFEDWKNYMIQRTGFKLNILENENKQEVATNSLF